MALNAEWRDRLNAWRNELPNHFYSELGEIELAGFVTQEQLSPEQAAADGRFASMPAGVKWGAKWDYCWFRAQVVLPASAAGKRIVARLNPGGEALVFVNGAAAGARDKFHFEIELARNAQGDETFDILIESYAGHGPRICSVGPTPPERPSIPDVDATQVEVGRNSFGIWNEEAFQLWLDIETLTQLRDGLEPKSLRVAEIDAGLKDFTRIVDFEVSPEERAATFTAARERLRSLLDCVNGSTAPTMYAFGHGHLDLAWLWPKADTERKSARTLSNQLSLAGDYEGYGFLQSQAWLYRVVKRRYPELYERLLAAVADGSVIADGCMWVEADTNITGGESLIRQFIHGMRFFRDELGAECKVLWLPDVFGFSGALPQIMRGCGVRYFATMKLFSIYHANVTFPHNAFDWEGIDGSQVAAYILDDYNSMLDPERVITRWKQRVQPDGPPAHLMPFGYGDGGGGPTRNHLEFARRMENLEGAPKIRLTTPSEFFEDLEANWPNHQRVVGELYYQCHRGTYTSQAKTKKGNRKCELMLREAELWGVAARVARGYAFSAADLDEAWKTILLNQFHDILPGSSIARVYAEAEADYADVLTTASKVVSDATASLAEDSAAITVFNSLSWQRKALVELPDDFPAVADESGEALAVQEVEGRRFVEATIPSCGWTTLLRADAPGKTDRCVQASETRLENEHLRVEFDAAGRITSVFDKESDREMSAGLCNEMKMYKDIPSYFDAWDIDSMYAETPVALDESAEVEVIAAGALLGAIRVRRTLNSSPMTQTISLRAGARSVEFETSIDWREDHKLLKAAFPLAVHSDQAIHEIQFGHVRRPTHRSGPWEAEQFEVCNQKYSALCEEGRGAALLNDCKYGLDATGNSLNLTLLKSAKAPDMDADKGLQEFTYALCAFNTSFAESEVVREGYELNCPVMQTPGAAGEESLLSVDAPNVIIETAKPAEDGSDDIIIRLYEAKRTATRCTLTTTLPTIAAKATDMLERPQSELPLTANKIELDFHPFEIKTVRLVVGSR